MAKSSTWVIAVLLMWCCGAILALHNRASIPMDRISNEELDQEDDDFDDSSAFSDEPRSSPVSHSQVELSLPKEMRFQESTAKTCSYWSKKTTSGTSPAGRAHAAAVVVSNGDRIVLAAGSNSDAVSVLDVKSSVWTSATAGGDAGGLSRTGAALASQDSAAGDGGANMFLFGGMGDDKKLASDVVVLEISAASPPAFSWAKLETQGMTPTPRQGSTLSPLADRRLVVIGGATAKGPTADVYFLKKLAAPAGSFSWTEGKLDDEAAAKPAGRSSHSAVGWSGANGQRVVVMGGQGKDGALLGDVWVLNPATTAGGIAWNKPALSGSLPSGSSAKRKDHTAILVGSTMYVFGGCDKSSCFADVLALELNAMSWTKVGYSTGGSTAQPPARGGAAMALKGSTLYIMSGCGTDGVSCFNGDAVSMLDTSAPCDADCKNGGSMVDGVCQCADGFSGKFCTVSAGGAAKGNSSKACPADCSGHGSCDTVTGACECNDGFTGSDCATAKVKECKDNCNSHGSCVDGKCQCDAGYHGASCAARSCPGATACSGNGKCMADSGICACYPGYGGEDCSQSGLCPSNCTGPLSGTCTAYKNTTGNVTETSYECKCAVGWSGVDCGTDLRCPLNLSVKKACNGNGTCSNFACVCNKGFTGPRCLLKTCPATNGVQCSGNGVCDNVTGYCQCEPKFTGLACNAAPKCAKPCGPNGYCVRDDEAVAPKGYDGVCQCVPPYEGDVCDVRACPKAMAVNESGVNVSMPCSGRGTCDSKTGKCACEAGIAGPACAQTCPVGSYVVGRADGDNDFVSEVPCSGRGQCVTNAAGKAQCACMAGRGGPACDVVGKCPSSLKNDTCSGNGRCHAGRCHCQKGFLGQDCSKLASCPRGAPPSLALAGGSEAEAAAVALEGLVCSGHGVCDGGVCYCAPGWNGNACGNKTKCPGDCSGHGTCSLAKCFCAPGWSGPACAKQLPCAMNCSGHGLCYFSKCVCESGFSGKGCDQFDVGALGLPADPTASKAAQPRFASVDQQSALALVAPPASTEGCPGGCGAAKKRGMCVLGRCMCMPGFNGADCSEEEKSNCPADCSNNGACKYNKCFCNPGWSGRNCSVAEKCLNNCNGNGECKYGKCYCNAGFRGLACEFQETCPNACSDRGLCVRGSCLCNPGFGGDDCSQVTTGTAICPKSCAGHGTCQIGQCFCDPGWAGRDCAHRQASPCPNECFGQGVCTHGQCFCHPGFTGEDCSEVLPCPPGCSKHGVCRYGRCFCQRGYGGDNCSTPIGAEEAALKAKEERNKVRPMPSRPCPNACSMHGFCFKGMCMCEPGYDGVACERVTLGHKQCPNGCRGAIDSSRLPGSDAGSSPARGLCSLGKCFCYPGFSGPACETETLTPCPADCSSNGICQYGKCFCNVGFEGEACELELKDCPHSCHGNGVCTRGRCLCHSGYTGEFCGKAAASEPCLNKCSGNGVCVLGQCVCMKGFTGKDCSHTESEQTVVKAVVGVSDTSKTLGASKNPDSITRGVIKGVEPPPPAPPVLPPPPTNLTLTTEGGDGSVVSINAEKPNAKRRAELQAMAKEAKRKAEANEVAAGVANKTFAAVANKTKYPLDLPKLPSNVTVDAGNSSSEAAGNASAAAGNSTGGEANASSSSSSSTVVAAGSESEGAAPRFKEARMSIASSKGRMMGETQGVLLQVSESLQVDHHCPSGCSDKGICHRGKCFCYPGYTGSDCSSSVGCPANCGGADRGVCNRGRCFCSPGFEGPDCSQVERCVEDCHGRGVCHKGACECHPGWSGVSCADSEDSQGAQSSCPSGCSGHGLCRSGVCYCTDGFAGAACDESDGSMFMAAEEGTASAAAAGPHVGGPVLQLSYFSVAAIGVIMFAMGMLATLLLQSRD